MPVSVRSWRLGCQVGALSHFFKGTRVLRFARPPLNGGGSHQLWLRHPTSSLPLLPSGPDGIHD